MSAGNVPEFCLRYTKTRNASEIPKRLLQGYFLSALRVLPEPVWQRRLRVTTVVPAKDTIP